MRQIAHHFRRRYEDQPEDEESDPLAIQAAFLEQLRAMPPLKITEYVSIRHGGCVRH